jgi:hypothetical protein
MASRSFDRGLTAGFGGISRHPVFKKDGQCHRPANDVCEGGPGRGCLALLGPGWRDRQWLPGGYHHPWTMFGSANVDLHAVSISADLTKSQEARNRAEQIDPENIPSRERRGRLGVEIARSYGQRQDYPGMLHWLELAYQTSADSVRYSPSARQLATEAVDHGGPLISRQARALAGSLGLPL